MRKSGQDLTPEMWLVSVEFRPVPPEACRVPRLILLPHPRRVPLTPPGQAPHGPHRLVVRHERYV